MHIVLWDSEFIFHSDSHTPYMYAEYVHICAAMKTGGFKASKLLEGTRLDFHSRKMESQYGWNVTEAVLKHASSANTVAE